MPCQIIKNCKSEVWGDCMRCGKYFCTTHGYDSTDSDAGQILGERVCNICQLEENNNDVLWALGYIQDIYEIGYEEDDDPIVVELNNELLNILKWLSKAGKNDVDS